MQELFMVSVCWNDPAGFLFKSLSLYRWEPLSSVMNFPWDKVILKFYFNVMGTHKIQMYSSSMEGCTFVLHLSA